MDVLNFSYIWASDFLKVNKKTFVYLFQATTAYAVDNDKYFYPSLCRNFYKL